MVQTVLGPRSALSFTWHPYTGKLDHRGLRQQAVYRLLKHGRIGRARGLELLCQRKIPHAAGLLDLWRSGPLKGMLP